jgi:hypothetical protein
MSPRLHHTAAAFALACAALGAQGCGGEPPRVGPHVFVNASGDAGTYEGITTSIMVPRCATGACHGGASPVNFPSCDADRWYDAMVNVPSRQASGMDGIEPGDAEKSYLVHKLRGTHGMVGGGGARMPIADVPLTDEEQAALEAWITNGATR